MAGKTALFRQLQKMNPALSDETIFDLMDRAMDQMGVLIFKHKLQVNEAREIAYAELYENIQDPTKT